MNSKPLEPAAPLEGQRCFICGDLARDPDRSGIARLYGEDVLDRAVLWQSTDLALLAAPGPLTIGYLILATVGHYLSFSHTNALVRASALQAIRRVSEFGKSLGLPKYVFFEHGMASPSARGAGCIEHAHLHLVPVLNSGSLRSELSANFQEDRHADIREIGDLAERGAYILLGCDEWLVSYRTELIWSQFLRRRVARQWGKDDAWDWRVHRHTAEFNATISLFADAVRS